MTTAPAEKHRIEYRSEPDMWAVVMPTGGVREWCNTEEGARVFCEVINSTGDYAKANIAKQKAQERPKPEWLKRKERLEDNAEEMLSALVDAEAMLRACGASGASGKAVDRITDIIAKVGGKS